MTKTIKWNKDLEWFDGKPYELGTISEEGREPQKIWVDLTKLKELHEAGEPFDAAITLVKLS